MGDEKKRKQKGSGNSSLGLHNLMVRVPPTRPQPQKRMAEGWKRVWFGHVTWGHPSRVVPCRVGYLFRFEAPEDELKVEI